MLQPARGIFRGLCLLFLFSAPVYLVTVLGRLDKEAFVFPVQHCGDIVIRSDSWGEGFFAANRSGGRRLHNGIDLYAELESPVLASRSGRVIAAQQNNGMGKYVLIQHAGGISTLYGHLSEIRVRNGQYVRQGMRIGSVGKTGNANHPGIQPHLHFEVRKDNLPQDPRQYLP